MALSWVPLIFLLFFYIRVQANVYSCGGFVKSSVPIDYSKVKIKLLTPEGHLKHEEGCNPQNGYYMIPVYSKGHYSVRVVAPDGWFFEPSTYDFKLDGATDKCSQNEDINFSLEGFNIDGSIQSSSGQGPPGLSLSLVQKGKIVASTATVDGGRYRFQAPPGEYTVTAGKDASVCISQNSAEVKVEGGPVVVPPLRISGFPLSLTASFPHVSMQLFAKTHPELRQCRPVTAEDAAPAGTIITCSLGETSSEGRLEVSCLPPGIYHIRPSKHSFYFEPSLAAIEIKNDKMEKMFRISGFHVTGRVTIAGRPLPNVQVYVDGRAAGETSPSGEYTLSNIKGGRISVTAQAPHYKFSLVEMLLSAEHLTVPDVVVETMELCGRVEKAGDGETEVLVLSSSSGDSSSIRPDASGKYCKWVAPGKYTLSPANRASSLSPSQLEIDMNSPRLDCFFTHFKTDVQAKVTCIGACQKMKMSLIAANGVEVASTSGVDSFSFRDVSPGKYTVGVATDMSRWCWEQSEMPLLVERSTPSPLHFVQSGFNAHIFLSHPAKIEWVHGEERQLKGEVAGETGVNEICLPTSGSYGVTILSCRTFDRQSLEVTVPSDSRIELHAVDAIITGRMEGAASAEDLRLSIRSSAGDRELPLQSTHEFSFHEPLTSSGSKIVLTPLSSTHLFEPLIKTLSFEGECIDKAVHFVATKGLFIEGRIEPPVLEVSIEAKHISDANIHFRTLSDGNGRFRIGPVRRVEDILMSASAEGYAFSEGKERGLFKSLKLSQLTLSFVDGESGKKLEDVTLYIRGSSHQKSTQHVGPSGEVKLTALAPDTFIRPFLQEYQFEPSTVTVQMKEGEHEEVILRGKRVAYSAYGHVREMNGAGVGDVVVEALSEECEQHQSEALTLTDGHFRIRGLRPHCAYRVAPRAVEKKPLPPHCFPAFFDIKMLTEDVTELEMVAAPSDEGVEVAVEVTFGGPSNLPQPSLKLQVVKDNSGETICMQHLPSPVNLYLLRNLTRDGAEYTVSIHPERSALAQFGSASLSFIADSPVKVLTLHVEPAKSAHEVEISHGSLLALPFFALLAAFIFNHEQWMSFFRSVIARLERRPLSNTSTSQSTSPQSLLKKKR